MNKIHIKLLIQNVHGRVLLDLWRTYNFEQFGINNMIFVAVVVLINIYHHFISWIFCEVMQESGTVRTNKSLSFYGKDKKFN